MTPDDGSDIRAELRRRTATRHAAVDRQMALDGRCATLADYGRFLDILRRWWGPLERAHWPALGAPWLQRIDKDLADMPFLLDRGQGGSTANAGEALSVGTARPTAYAWGVRYVMEGSQLGSAILYRQLASRFAPHPLHYLRGDAGGPGPRWHGFLQQLSQQVPTPVARRAAVAGACDAFDGLIELSASSHEEPHRR